MYIRLIVVDYDPEKLRIRLDVSETVQLTSELTTRDQLPLTQTDAVFACFKHLSVDEMNRPRESALTSPIRQQVTYMGIGTCMSQRKGICRERGRRNLEKEGREGSIRLSRPTQELADLKVATDFSDVDTNVERCHLLRSEATDAQTTETDRPAGRANQLSTG